jgi:hypothetical protein
MHRYPVGYARSAQAGGAPTRRPHNKAASDSRTPIHHSQEVSTVKNCKLCKYSKVCNDLPGICVLIPYVAVAVVAVALAYLFVTQELL